MQSLIDFGISLIVALQSMGDWLIAPMKFFSYLGNEEFFLLVLPLLYWSVDSALGLRVGVILVTSNLFNNVFKLIFAGPRPYWVSSHVRALWTETSFGIPSGHAQNAVTVWGMIAAYYKRTWVWATAIALIFLIGFSRIFLAAHFPHDVVFGWLLGAILLWAFMRFWEPIAARVNQKTLAQKILIAFITSMLFIALGFGATSLRSGFQIPQTWMDNARLAGDELPDPVDPNSTFTSAGTFFGLAAGAAWILSLGGYQAAGPIQKRAIRYVIGLVGVLILYMGLGQIFPRDPDLISYALRFVRYTLIGFWVAGGAPWVFKKIKLAE
ncbi:MAG: phosphatase PAP2 family protein [Chloroflexi bacterium]|nr:phosphatase PAP2 family protein [Chloroflexota bacterium]